MTRARVPGPTWREPAPPAEPEAERVFVACRCGADMDFAWPRGRDVVRCFGCGARFPRPLHLPALPRGMSPPPPAPRVSRPQAALLLLVAFAAGLLGAALTLAAGAW